jgi:FdhE protein
MARWPDHLLLNDFAMSAVPEQAREVIASLRNRRIDAVEALAVNFLHGSVDAADAGAALYVVAALQVYFTGLAAALPAPALRLFPQRGLCPCCGSTSVSSVVTECIRCGQSRSVVLKEIAGDSGTAKAETCDDCRSDTKVLYQAQDTKLDPFADDLATLALNVLVGGAGWSRHAPNPLLLIG